MHAFRQALCVLPLLPSAVLAATEPDEIVVYGSRLDQDIAKVGSSVSVLTTEDLEQQGYAFVLDALAATPGVTVNRNGAFGGAASLRIRGAGTDQTLVLIDGVPVGDTSSVGGAFDFARLDVAQIERIEVLRGPQSTLWGSEAIGGVVSITTKRPENTSLTAFVEGGSFDTVRGGASMSVRDAEKGGLRIAGSAISSEGISKADEEAGNTEEDGFDSASVSAALDTQVLGLGLDLRLFYQTANTETDSFDFTAPGSVADGDENTETEEFNASLAITLPSSSDGFEHTLLLGHNRIDRDNFLNGAPNFDAEGQRSILRYQATAKLSDRIKLALGGEGDLRQAGGDDTSIASAFALVEAAATERLTLSGGLRIDDHEAFGSETTGRVAAAFAATDTLTLRANWGQGFKAPSLFQQTFFCCGAAAPNPDLAPERSEGYEIGARFARGGLSLDIVTFVLETENLIDFSFIDGSYVNIDEVRTNGIETSGSARLLPWLEAQVSYAFLDAEDGDGNRLVRIPRHSGDAALIADPKGPFSAALNLRYNGEENDNFGITEDWTRLDLNLRYQLREAAELYLRAENLADADYQEIFGYGTPGRSAYAGLRLHY